MIHFDLPKEKSSIIKVIGIGGGGSNAVNYMHNQGIEGVNFVICNTDAQAIAHSKVPNKVQLGPHLTQGLGAGANPEIGRQATEESLEEIRRILEVNTKMAFITAGMGGGTGTGGAPIIARICKDMGVLTVGIITTPFAYEGKKRIQQAEEGINRLKDNVDTLLVISNDKLRHQYGNLKMKEAFAKADNVLATAAKCITDVINSTGQINVDFADVCTVMRNGGVAILGSGSAEGDNRAQRAIEHALNSPLLNDNDIRGAKWILININSAEGDHEFTMDEVDIIQNYLLSQAGEDSDVIMGLGYDPSLGSKIGITLIATGFDNREISLGEETARPQSAPVKEEKIVMTLGMEGEEKKIYNQAALFSQEPTAAGAAAATAHAAAHAIPAAAQAIPAAAHAIPAAAHAAVTAPGAAAQVAPAPPPRVEPEPDEMAPTLVESTPREANFFISRVENTKNPSRSFLSRPATIYEENQEETPMPSMAPEAPRPSVVPAMPEDTPTFDMQLVIKDEPKRPESIRTELRMELKPEPQIPQAGANPEEDEQKRKAAERLQKLRNLSFNQNAQDTAGEFDAIPAYMRRNMELYNTVSSIENFYSNYTVKPAENNKGEISTLNTFLDGKKPD